MRKTNSKYLIIGIGNPLREDDAFGIEAARSFKALYPNEAEVIEVKDDLSRLIHIWNKRKVIILDAVSSKSDSLFEIHDIEDIIHFKETIRNTHSIDLLQALNLSNELNLAPDSIYFLGISSTSFELGKKMNGEIKRRIPEIVQKIYVYMRR